VDRLRGFDLFAVAAGVIAVLMTWAYVAIVHSQGDQPLGWVIAGLLCGASLAAYGAGRRLPYRQVALIGAAGVLGILGLLAILSIGLPILVAAGLAMVAFILSVATPSRPPSASR
jgi:hypothetical protein